MNNLPPELEKARADALRQSFLLGGAMADLERASDELKAIAADAGIDFNAPPEFRVIDGQKTE